MHSQKSTKESANNEHAEICGETGEKTGEKRQNQCRHNNLLTATLIRQKAPKVRAHNDSNRRDARQNALVLRRQRQITFSHGKNKTYA